MSSRRILPLLEIDAGMLTCGRCQYLQAGPRCGVLTGTLDRDEGEVIRAEECLAAEARAQGAGA